MIRTVACSIILIALASAVTARAETVYFVVARPIPYQLGIGDSYVLPLTDPADIATARDLISGSGFLIALAFVTKGSDGINRDVVATGEPLWSWHVAEFVGFGPAAIELCDGSPTYTEGESQSWADGALVEICYWEYTVVDELAPVPVDRSTWGRIKASYRSSG